MEKNGDHLFGNTDEEPLGIPEYYEFGCIVPREGIEQSEEFLNISYFIRDFYDNCIFIKDYPHVKIQFINWGYTGLVYVLKVYSELNKNYNLYAMTINQPSVSYEIIKQDYNNLREFGTKHPKDIVRPIHFYSNPQMGFACYISDYIYQARCISNEDAAWGRFIPEPEYHYKEFSQSQQQILLPCIIAKLIVLSDSENNKGIASCKTIDGDFILDKKIEQEKFTSENIMNRMKLITIRDTINVSLEEYIDLIKREFSTLPQKDYKINSRAKLIISPSEIEKGIKMGLELRKKYRQDNEIMK